MLRLALGLVLAIRVRIRVRDSGWGSISISGMLTLSHLAMEKVKPKWLPMEVTFEH